MLAKVRSSVLHGIDAQIVEIEVDIVAGLPGTTIVGLPDTAVKESKDRVKTAIRNLPEVVQFLKGEFTPKVTTCNREDILSKNFSYDVDFSEVIGQEHAKRGLEVAAAGGHNILVL